MEMRKREVNGYKMSQLNVYREIVSLLFCFNNYVPYFVIMQFEQLKLFFAVFVCLNNYSFIQTQQMFFKYSLGGTFLNFLKGRVPVSLITLRAISYSQNPDYPGKGCA